MTDVVPIPSLHDRLWREALPALRRHFLVLGTPPDVLKEALADVEQRCRNLRIVIEGMKGNDAAIYFAHALYADLVVEMISLKIECIAERTGASRHG